MKKEQNECRDNTIVDQNLNAVKIGEQKIPCRNLCGICGELCYVDFWVPDEMWQEAIRARYQGGPVCLHCFCVRADDKNLEWDKEIKFYPTSAVSQRKVQASL